MASRDLAERTAIASLGGNTRWAAVAPADRADATSPAREALRQRFLHEADPTGELPEHEREQRAESLRKIYYSRLALAKAQKQRREREAAELEALAALEAEVGEERSSGPAQVPAPRRGGRDRRTNP